MLENLTNPTFIALATIGVVVVLLFSIDKFNEPSFSRRADEPETLFLPRYLALRHQYVRGLAMYIGGTEVLFLLFTIAGPKFLTNLQQNTIQISPETWPLAAALLITGIIPNIKWLQKLEEKWRRVCHENAYIPDGAKETAHKITHAKFDPGAYRSDISSDHAFNELKEYFDEREDRIIRNWVKISCILHALGRELEDDANSSNFDRNFLSSSKAEIDQLKADFKRDQRMFKNYLIAKAKTKDASLLAENSNELIQEIKRLMKRVCTIVSCAVRAKQSSEEGVFRSLGDVGFFVVRGGGASRGLLDVLFLSLACVCGLVFAGVYISQNMMSSSNVFREGYSRLDVAAIWSFLVLGFHGIAALVAAYLRELKLRRGTWRDRPLSKTWISLFAAFCGYAFLLGYFAAKEPLTLEKVWLNLIWLPLPFVTAYSTLEFFNVPSGETQLEDVLRSCLDGVIQGGVTALFAVFACEAWIELSAAAARAPQGDAREWTKFIILNVFILGFCFGCLLPAAYRKATQLTDEDAIKDRRQRIEELAQKVFANEVERERWFKTPLRELDGSSPILAINSFYLCNRAEQILRRRLVLQET